MKCRDYAEFARFSNTEVASGVAVLHDEFEWDEEKAEANKRKHGISFEQATVVFKDPLAITISDPEHSDFEDRSITIGASLFDDVFVVIHTEREDRIRIISARLATNTERRKYMNEKFDRIHDREQEDPMRPEYDFSGGVRGKFWKGPGRKIITHMRIDQDVRRHFRTADEVNAALRMLIAEGRAPEPRDE